jgi:hypothetical protein
VELRGLEPLTSSMPWWPGTRMRETASMDGVRGRAVGVTSVQLGSPSVCPPRPKRDRSDRSRHWPRHAQVTPDRRRPRRPQAKSRCRRVADAEGTDQRYERRCRDLAEIGLEFGGGAGVFVQLAADDFELGRGSSRSLGVAAGRGERNALASSSAFLGFSGFMCVLHLGYEHELGVGVSLASARSRDPFESVRSLRYSEGSGGDSSLAVVAMWARRAI